MQVTEIVVSAGRTFNHPYESYSNLRPQVTMKATLQDGEDVDAATQALQAKAEKLVEDHKMQLLSQLEELNRLSMARQEMADLEQRLKGAQSRLKQLRESNPQLSLVPAGHEEEFADEESGLPPRSSEDELPL